MGRKREAVAHDGSSGGNTRLQKKQRISASKYWCFTWNHYPEDGVAQLVTKFREADCRYIVGKEVGEEGTPHLQGYLESSTKIRPVEKFGIKEIHWEKRKGTALEAATYCTKEGDYSTDLNIIVRDPLIGRVMHQWQTDLLEILNQEASDRKIYWVWEPVGGSGKTSFLKHFCIKHKDALVVGGKANDAKYMIASLDWYPKFVFFNISRTVENFVSYEGMEAIKDWLFASTKYEGKMVIGNCPHLIVMANFEPNYSAMSGDRWVVMKIGEDLCFEE